MVIAALRSFFHNASRVQAQNAYIALVEESRHPFFYTECEVPDTLDGRFEIILLHVFLTLRLLKEGRLSSPSSRLLQECLFDDMDRNLREMGVGDMGISRRIKAMSKAAYGRFEAYARDYDDEAAFAQALQRNVYRGARPQEQALAALAHYARHYKQRTEEK